MAEQNKKVIVPGEKEDPQVMGLLGALAGKNRLLILTHTNPDPDGLASGLALRHLVYQMLGLESVQAYKGDIFRAENQMMVEALGYDLVRLRDLDVSQFDALALVDTQPGFGHTVIPKDAYPDVVVDHHVSPSGIGLGAAFVDVRSDVGATASIMTEYLLQEKVELTVPVATALFYGLRTDTADLSRNVSPLDEKVHLHLLPFVDRSLLRQITNPPLPLAYFRAFHQALTNAEVYGNVVACSLGRTNNPEMVAEMADLVLRLEGADWGVCGGLYENTYFISIRALDGLGKDAYLLLRDILQGEGTFGGHGTVAGGRVTMVDNSDRGLKRLELELKKSLLEALGERGKRPVSIDL